MGKTGAECREREAGNTAEDEDLGKGGGSGPDRRELLRVKDWVLCQEEGTGKRSEAGVSKGSDFHCASCWRPFNPFICAEQENRKNQNKVQRVR